ncbi:MAG: SURF1 family cytochrome oxidase biogenesis protein [Actinomycetes bacterium]
MTEYSYDDKPAVTWWRVALRPSWILALLLSLAIAAAFGLLGQWQLGRAFESNHALTPVAKPAVPVEQLMTASQTIGPNVVGRKATASVMLDQTMIFIIEDRLQLDGRHGYWLVAAANEANGNRLFEVLGFTADRKVADRIQYELATSAQVQAFMPVAGILGGTEGPVAPFRGRTARSLSLAQLVNAQGAKLQPTYPAFLILEKQFTPKGLEPITMKPVTEAEVNWLNAFYAAEWALFAGFAVFLWWRLVRDAQQRELEAEAKNPK